MTRLCGGLGWSLLSCAALVAACSGGTSGGSSVATTSDSFLQQYCDLVVPCCSTVMKMGTSAGCQQVYNAVIGSNVTYDGTKGSKCLDELRADQSKPDFCTVSSTDAPDCKNVFKQGSGGAKQPGDTCMQDGDCAPSSDGDVLCASFSMNGAETRICQVQIDGKAGDTPCLGTRDGNLTSSFGSGTMMPPAKGYICDVAKGIACSSKTNTCVVIPTTGQPCDTTAYQYACVKTAYCDVGTKMCVDRIAAGSSCAKQPTGCVDTAYCDTTTMMCTATLAAGAPCKTSNQCGSSASCTNGTCQSYSSGSLGLELICH
jgi:hypothetical protein